MPQRCHFTDFRTVPENYSGMKSIYSYNHSQNLHHCTIPSLFLLRYLFTLYKKYLSMDSLPESESDIRCINLFQI